MPEGIKFLASQVTKMRESTNASRILLLKFVLIDYCGKHEARWEEGSYELSCEDGRQMRIGYVGAEWLGSGVSCVQQ